MARKCHSRKAAQWSRHFIPFFLFYAHSAGVGPHLVHSPLSIPHSMFCTQSFVCSPQFAILSQSAFHSQNKELVGTGQQRSQDGTKQNSGSPDDLQITSFPELSEYLIAKTFMISLGNTNQKLGIVLREGGEDIFFFELNAGKLRPRTNVESKSNLIRRTYLF